MPGTNYGSSGGSNTITVDNMPSHNHTGTTNKDGGHDHTVTGTVASGGTHTHTANHNYVYNTSGNIKLGSSTSNVLGQLSMNATMTNSNGAHSHSFTGGRAWSGSAASGDFLSVHTHNFTTSSKGSGTAYWQPYRVCYC